MLIKHSVFDEYSIDSIDKSYDGILAIKFISKHTEYSFVLISGYLPPENSVWGRDSQGFFAHALSLVYSYSECDAVFLCGDLNSRIGSLDDTSDFDDINIPQRTAIDTTTNQHGNSFIEFLNEAKMCVLKGRFDNDNFTSVSTRGRAVVDYICVPHENFDQCVSFKIMTSRSVVNDGNLTHLPGERSKVPDHSAIVLEFRTKHEIHSKDNATSAQKRYKLKSLPNDFMSSNLSKLALQTIITRIEFARETQGEIDAIYENLCDVIVSEMNTSIPVFDSSKKSRKRFKSTKPFWNNELRDLWNVMHETEKRYLRFHGNTAAKSRLRTDFLIAQRSFDRKLRQTERAYRKSFCNDIEGMTTENPNEFWEKIKRLGPRQSTNIPMEIYGQNGEILTDENIVLETWKQDFENLYNNGDGNDFNTDFHREALSHKLLLEDRMLDPLYISNPELNHNITITEIERLVMNAKNGKSVGIDCIPYEVLKFPPVIQVLHSLFQLIFDTGITPSLWRKAIICPILKDPASDRRILMNYRGISLLSCISKLYSAFLNDRISKYLEHNDLLSDEQNGFRANRSCEDHVFTLNSIIRNNSNVYTTFIDLKKAFDFVDRDMLLYKLLLNNIDGKVYNSVKSIYAETSACIRINGTKTDWFFCKSGVKHGDNCSPTLFSIFIDDLVKELNNLGLGCECM